MLNKNIAIFAALMILSFATPIVFAREGENNAATVCKSDSDCPTGKTCKLSPGGSGTPVSGVCVKNSHNGVINTISSTTITCLATAVSTRETALDAAIATHTQAVQAAYSARATALAQAYTNTTWAAVNAAVKAAWATFRTSLKSAQQAWKTAQAAAWTQFKTAAKACKVPTSTIKSESANSNSEVSGN